MRNSPTSLPRAAYADMFGPTTGDKVRLGDTSLIHVFQAVANCSGKISAVEPVKKKGLNGFDQFFRIGRVGCITC